METLFAAFVVLWFGTPPVAAGIWFLDRWRARRRNRQGECAACGRSWQSMDHDEPFLFQGRLVCASCATTARRRLVRQLGLLGFAAAAATILAVRGADDVLLMFWPVTSVIAMTAGAFGVLKWTNRKARAEILSGRLRLPG